MNIKQLQFLYLGCVYQSWSYHMEVLLPRGLSQLGATCLFTRLESSLVNKQVEQRGTKANTIGYWHRTIYLVTPGGWAICMSMKSTFFLWISAAAVLSMSLNQNWYFFRLSKENIMWQDLSLLHLQYASKDPRQTGGSCYTQVFGMSW